MTVAGYTCKLCGHSEDAWYGQCPECESWSTMLASAGGPRRPPASVVASPSVPSLAQHTTIASPPALEYMDPISAPIPITEIETTESERTPCGLEPVDRVLGGGLVVGSAILLGGEPGIGKSTLLLQWLAGTGQSILYASGEESLAQVAMRARRIGASVDRILLVPETNADRIIQHARAMRPAIIAIDSIQTMVTADAPGGPGSVAQVKACASKIVSYGKDTGTPVILVGHVTKDGGLAGPKTLAHLVDAILSLEIDPEISNRIRFLSATKNRFGSTMEQGALEMTATGMICSDEIRDETEPRDRDEIYQPLAQELLNRYIAGGGNVDAGLRERIGELLDLEQWRETR
jgi:DNA repair protein RadA/Sms